MLASETNKRWHKGYVSGAFDMFHIGHLNLIRRAKERCDYLIAGVLTDEHIARSKSKWPVIPLVERMEIVGALKYVDETDVTTEPLLNKLTAWDKYHFDAMFSGDDHMYDGWTVEESELKARGADLVFFPYTKEVTTTLLQDITLPPKADNSNVPKTPETFNYIFPFDRVNKGSRIIIYGAGLVGAQYAAQLAALNYCEILAFADTYAKEGSAFAGKPCFTPDEFKRNMYAADYIVAAAANRREQILNVLRSLGVKPDKII